jgi:small-conductance mechanosensitive channel
MDEFFSQFKEWFQTDQARAILKALAAFVIGLVAAFFVRRMKLKKLHVQHTMVLQRILSFIILVVAVLWGLHELGLDMGVLLGAAGILTVALGFASQTSVSNLISGVFLMAERPFQVGDLIKVGEQTGFVLSIDFLSVKLRTFDNLMVRIPNENMLKSEVINLTRFPIRRVDLKIGVAYKEDTARVRGILFTVADANPLCLDEPRPVFFFLGYGDSALEYQFSVWTIRDNFYPLRTALYEEIKVAFDRAGVEIPFPHRTLYTGAVTDPFPVRLVEGTPAVDPTESASD